MNDRGYPINVTVNDATFSAPPGWSRRLVAIRPGQEVRVTAEDGTELRATPEFSSPRRFTVYVVPTVHFDYGYTDLQENVEALYRDNIKEIVRLLDNGGKFNLEVIGQAVDYVDSLLRYNASGSLGVQGMPLNVLTGLMSHEELVRMFYWLRDLRRRGFRVVVAALNDVPTAVWSLPSVLASAGVKYYIQASNFDRGPLHWLNPDLPTPFTWVGPDGQGVVAWFTGGYRGLIPGYHSRLLGFHGYHQGFSAGLLDSLEEAEAGLAHYVTTLEERGYPYDLVLLYGMFVDNSRVSDRFVRVINEFNAKWDNPRVELATSDEFFERFSERYQGLPEVRGSFGSYWEDGAASTAEETAMSRRAKRLLFLAEAYYAMAYAAGGSYPGDELSQAWRDVIYYDEHTWGAWNSVSEPLSDFVEGQWATKAGFAARALARAEELAYGPYLVNPYPYRVSGLVDGSLVSLDYMEAAHATSKELAEVQGPAGGTIRVEAGNFEATIRDGRLESLYLKDLGREVMGDAEYGIDELVYVKGGRGTSVERPLEGFPVEEPREAPRPRLEVVREYRSELLGVFENDDVVKLVLRSQSYLTSVVKEVYMSKRTDEVFISNVVTKAHSYDKEGVYFAFPFSVKPSSVMVEEPGAFVDISKDIVRGGCRLWYAVNESVLLRGQPSASLASYDAPLVTVGGVFDGDWRRDPGPSGLIMSYVMNNYWHTNYRAAQGGTFTFSYRLSFSGSDMTPLQAHLASLTPLRGRKFKARLSLTPGAAVTSIKRWDLGDGIVLRLLELDGEPRELRLRSELKGFEAFTSTLLEDSLLEDLGPADDVKVRLRPRGYATLVLSRSARR